MFVKDQHVLPFIVIYNPSVLEETDHLSNCTDLDEGSEHIQKMENGRVIQIKMAFRLFTKVLVKTCIYIIISVIIISMFLKYGFVFLCE